MSVPRAPKKEILIVWFAPINLEMGRGYGAVTTVLDHW